MKRLAAIILLGVLSVGWSVQAYARPRTRSAQNRDSRKADKKIQKARKKYMKAQRKAQRKMIKKDRKNTKRF
jgi:cellobiose-specific phosphotransferase system component IIA